MANDYWGQGAWLPIAGALMPQTHRELSELRLQTLGVPSLIASPHLDRGRNER